MTDFPKYDATREAWLKANKPQHKSAALVKLEKTLAEINRKEFMRMDEELKNLGRIRLGYKE